jgi:hypothetical protein
MFTLNKYTKNRFFSGLLILSLMLVFSSCKKDSGGPSLDGDLRYLVEGNEGESTFLSFTSYTENEINSATIGGVTLNSSGSEEGDLEDGNFSGYQLFASSLSGDTPSITLKLLSDGDVLGETNELSGDGFYIIEVGDIPEFEF